MASQAQYHKKKNSKEESSPLTGKIPKTSTLVLPFMLVRRVWNNIYGKKYRLPPPWLPFRLTAYLVYVGDAEWRGAVRTTSGWLGRGLAANVSGRCAGYDWKRAGNVGPKNVRAKRGSGGAVRGRAHARPGPTRKTRAHFPSPPPPSLLSLNLVKPRRRAHDAIFRRPLSLFSHPPPTIVPYGRCPEIFLFPQRRHKRQIFTRYHWKIPTRMTTNMVKRSNHHQPANRCLFFKNISRVLPALRTND